MSLYAEYLKERTYDKILELDFGFITYRHLEDQKTTYIVDIFVLPKFRRQGFATKLADEIAKEAISAGHTRLIGTVDPSMKNSTESIKTLLSYGMKLQSLGPNFIIFEKELK